MIIALAHFANEPKENPYVWRLGSALKRLGIDVRPLPASSLFLFRFRSARIASTIHFQWFETQVGSPIFLKMFMKTILFLLQVKLCKVFRKRLVWTLHNSLSHEARYPLFEKWGMRRMAAMVDTIAMACFRRPHAILPICCPCCPAIVVRHQPQKIRSCTYGNINSRCRNAGAVNRLLPPGC